MKSNDINRRRFLGTVAAASAGIATSGFTPVFGHSREPRNAIPYWR